MPKTLNVEIVDTKREVLRGHKLAIKKGRFVLKKNHNIMRVSGWLPVSYSVYMRMENDALYYFVNPPRECDNAFYSCMKIVADTINDDSDISNKRLINKLNKFLASQYSSKIHDEDKINLCIDFIRDSLIIYQDTIKQDQEWKSL